MLDRTFVHCPGLGEVTERRLWKQGCESWDCFLAEPKRFSVGSASKSAVTDNLVASQSALASQNHQFFARKLRQKHAWRAYEAFSNSCVYLDIETDGTSSRNSVTTIGMYDGQTYRCLVQGQDLENFRDLISHYSMIVTFFGAGFDLPVLQKRFRGLFFDQIHLDLCPTLKLLGIRGGLKKIETDFGIERSPETQGLTGFDAVKLWRRYRHGSEAALETLIAYNREDVVNLKTLADLALPRLKRFAETGKATSEDVAQPTLI